MYLHCGGNNERLLTSDQYFFQANKWLFPSKENRITLRVIDEEKNEENVCNL